MRSVLVPLDGTDLAEGILPDARRVAGENGRLILVRDAIGRYPAGVGENTSPEGAKTYLCSVARCLRREGVTVEVHALHVGDAAVAIDQASQVYSADMIAVGTHGRSPAERWRHGSIAWRAMARSSVPVLLRHLDGAQPQLTEPTHRRILVPLDGSLLAERAIPLARELSTAWNAPLFLAQVIPPSDPETGQSPGPATSEQARQYLRAMEHRAGMLARGYVLEGHVVDRLVAAVGDLGITDIVMTSHGVTGVSRVIVGSIADELIHRLHYPIIVIPPLITLAG